MINTNDTAELFQSDLQAAIEKSLILNPGQGETLTREIFKNLQMNLGGVCIYIPVQSSIRLRNQDIKAKFNGRNHAEICKQHNISLRTLYRIISK